MPHLTAAKGHQRHSASSLPDTGVVCFTRLGSSSSRKYLVVATVPFSTTEGSFTFLFAYPAYRSGTQNTLSAAPLIAL
jgi:hypothetical protein